MDMSTSNISCATSWRKPTTHRCDCCQRILDLAELEIRATDVFDTSTPGAPTGGEFRTLICGDCSVIMDVIESDHKSGRVRIENIASFLNRWWTAREGDL